MTASASKEHEMVARQVSWARVYCLELSVLEQPKMPPDAHERIMRLRFESAPDFFDLVARLLKDALILTLASLLGPRQTAGEINLCVDYLIENERDPDVKANAANALSEIHESPTYKEILAVRNRLLAHPDHSTVVDYDKLAQDDFASLHISDLHTILEKAVGLVALLTRKSSSDFLVPNWRGAGQLFDRLGQAAQG